MKYALFLLLFILSGCSTLHPLQENILVSNIIKDNEILIADHHLTFIRGNDTHTILTHIEITPDHFSFVGFGSLGEGLFECRIDDRGNNCTTLLKKIPAQHLFNDIQLIFLSADELEKIIKKPNFELQENAQIRLISYRNKPFNKITYDGLDRWQSDIVFQNIQYNYQVNLRPLSIQKGGLDE